MSRYLITVHNDVLLYTLCGYTLKTFSHHSSRVHDINILLEFMTKFLETVKFRLLAEEIEYFVDDETRAGQKRVFKDWLCD